MLEAELIERIESWNGHTGVLALRLNRPDRRNALTRQMLQQAVRMIQDIAGDPQVRVLVLQSSGPVFCAGMDLGEMQQRAAAADKEQQWQLDSEIYCDLLEAIFTLPIPTIAQVQGPVLAGGVGIVLACDMIVASDEAFFALPEPMRGITAAMVTPFLAYRVGAGVAGQWLLSGERISAERARQCALCLDTVSADALSERVDVLVEKILAGSPAALSISKQHLITCAGGQVIELARASIAVSALARQTADAREGLQAFLEKRAPNWQRLPS